MHAKQSNSHTVRDAMDMCIGRIGRHYKISEEASKIFEIFCCCMSACFKTAGIRWKLC